MEPRVVAGRICMIALQSVVLPMPLRPMMATGSSPIVEGHALQHVRRAVEGVQARDLEQRAVVGIELADDVDVAVRGGPAFALGRRAQVCSSSSPTRPPR